MRRKNRVTEMLAKIGVKIDLRIFRFNQQLARTVVKEKGNVQTFFCDFLPFAGSAFIALLPCNHAVEKARRARYRSWNRIRSGRNPIDFDQAKRHTADL